LTKAGIPAMAQPYANRLPRPFMTDIPAQRDDGTWARHTTMIPPPFANCRLGGLLSRGAARRALAIAWGLRLFCSRHRFAGAITTGSGPGTVFGLLQALPGFRRVPHVMVDCLWYAETNPLLRWLARAKFRALIRSVSCFVVWASPEVAGYSQVLEVPRSKLRFVPHHHTLEGYGFAVCDGGYVFAGGDGDRDYQTLVEAVKGLGVRLVIATRRREWLTKAGLPANVSVRPMGAAEFRRVMAGARVVVVPMKRGLLHLGGQQTYLNAMAMGKPVVVCEERGAPDYLDDGVTGLIVPAGCVSRLRAALTRLLGDAGLREAMGRGAAAAVQERNLSTEGCMRRIVALAYEQAAQSPRGQSAVMAMASELDPPKPRPAVTEAS
jgi:glycosyltransferase involved in cell wall biosynthesis